MPTPSATWADRGRTVVWLQCRLLLGCAVSFLTVHLPMLAVDLANTARGGPADPSTFVRVSGHHWWHMLLVPLPLLVLAAVVVAAGGLMTALARPLLGPSPAERLAALEARTDRLLERNRIAHELHDSIGHALTVAVVPGRRRATAGDPGFTDRALAAIEETGRAALEDLERVLGVLREPDKPVSSRPTLVDADRLLESARASGAKVDADVTGPLDTVPGPVSREGYRILQESLTNALRHAGAVPVRVGVRVAGGTLLLEVRNPLTEAVPGPGRGSGLRGIRERAHCWAAGRGRAPTRATGGCASSCRRADLGWPGAGHRSARRRRTPRTRRSAGRVGGAAGHRGGRGGGRRCGGRPTRAAAAAGRGRHGRAHAAAGRDRGHARAAAVGRRAAEDPRRDDVRERRVRVRGAARGRRRVPAEAGAARGDRARGAADRRGRVAAVPASVRRWPPSTGTGAETARRAPCWSGRG
ncbi:hypothetical protein GCM10023238_23950 [Streptomyces heliomycini]